MYELRHHEADGHDLVQEWLDDLRDQQARIAVLRRFDRVAAGNFGDLSSAETVSGNCGLMLMSVIAFTTRYRGAR